MNAPLRPELTPTALKAHERRNAFHSKIAAHADALVARQSAAIGPESMAAETDPPVAPARGDDEVPVFSFSTELLYAYPSMQNIVSTAARYYRVTVLDLKSARRTADIVWPRQVAMYLCRHLTPFSMPMIGRHFGGRDHTTVLHAVRKVEEVGLRDCEKAYDIALLFVGLRGDPQ